MEQYGTQTLRVCRLYLHNGALAQDAAQESFLRLWRALDSVRTGGWIDGPFDEFCPVAPGETLTGSVHALYGEGITGSTVSTTCKVLAEDGEVHFVHLSFELLRADGTVTRPVETEFTLPGYVLRVTEANFAPGSSRVAFEVIPENPEDTHFDAEGDRGRLYRRYAVLAGDGEDLCLTRETTLEFGRNEDGVLSYVFLCNPLPRVPEQITIVPLSGGEYVMEEAVEVRIEN